MSLKGYTKIIRSGNQIEVYQYEKRRFVSKRIRGADTYRKTTSRTKARRPDSIRRASKAFRRIVRSNLAGDACPVLLTLTMRQKLPYPASCKLFTQFIARLRRRYGAAVRYIAVPEFQKRGAVHWHLLIWGLPAGSGCTGYVKRQGKYTYFVETCPPEKDCERKTRSLARLWLRGFADCIETDGHAKLIGYLTKYLSKAMHDLRYGGTKAYYASRNVMRPMSVAGNSLIDYIEELVPVDMPPLHQREFDTEWLGRCIYKQYEI